MLFTIKNIGSLKEGTIDINKNLLIFCGNNNTGKTYMSYAVYAWVKLMPQNTIPKLTEYIEKYILELVVDKKTVIDLSIIINQFKALDKEEMNQIFKEDLASTFATNETFVKDMLMDFDWVDDLTHFKTLNIEETRLLNATTELQIEKKRNDTNYYLTLSGDILHYQLTINSITSLVMQDLFSSILYPGLSAHFISSERIGVGVFGDDVLVNRATNTDLGKVNKYTNIVKKSLEIHGQLAKWSKNQTSFAAIANELEQRILAGKLAVSNYGETLFKPKGTRNDLSNNLTSSTVKSLFDLIFYLRHIAPSSYSFLIIDEPEQNLHPRNQRILARILAQMVNAGIKLLISTHSDYIIKEINHCIMLHNANPKAQQLQKKMGFKQTELLDYTQIGVYHFKNGYAKSIEVSEVGFDVESIEDEIREQGNEGMLIYQTLYENE